MRSTTGQYQKGASGNPGGRPKGLSAALRLKYGDDAAKLVAALEAIAFSRSKRMPPRVRVDALRELLNRHSGKAPDIVRLDDPSGELVGPVTFVLRGRAQ